MLIVQHSRTDKACSSDQGYFHVLRLKLNLSYEQHKTRNYTFEKISCDFLP